MYETSFLFISLCRCSVVAAAAAPNARPSARPSIHALLQVFQFFRKGGGCDKVICCRVAVVFYFNVI